MKYFCKIIVENNEWLHQKFYELVREKNNIRKYFKDEKYLLKAIDKSTACISDIMIQKINTCDNYDDFTYNIKLPTSMMSFILLMVRKHMELKIDTRSFIDFEKAARRSYSALINNFVPEPQLKGRYLSFICAFFDAVETELCVEWTKYYEHTFSKEYKGNNQKNDTDESINSASSADEFSRIKNILIESEAKFKTLTETTATAIFINDGNYFTYVNPAAEKLTGYSKEELYSMTIGDLVNEEFKSTITDCTMTENKDNAQVARYELVIVTKLGKRLWLDVSAGVVFLDEKTQLIISAFDITERKNTEYMLRKSEKQYHQLVELIPDAILVMKDQKIVLSNAAGLKLLGGHSVEDAMGKAVSNFFQYNDKSNGTSHDVIDVNIGSTYPYVEQKLLRKSDGKTIDIESSAMSCTYNGSPAVMLYCRDLLERRRVEELSKSADESKRLLQEAVEYDKLKTEFFSNISHELRTPINVILGTLQLSDYFYKNGLIESNIGKMEKYNGIMKQNCYRLVRLVNNLIDITKIDSGYFQINLSNCNIVNIIEEITLSVADYVENKGIQLIFDTDVEEKYMACDPDKIERIVLNILSNAIKYTEPGGEILVNVYDMAENIIIRVKDSGIGIPSDKQNLIFERFVQVDKSLSRNREGSGIGLSLVRSLVEMHGGRIWVKSTYGKGSEFYVKLPVSVISEEGNQNCEDNFTKQRKIETIQIEFSDIY